VQKILISIGSNMGERTDNCRGAIDALVALDGLSVLKESSFYETMPWGKINQQDFINCAVLVESDIAPLNLLEKLKEIEFNIGSNHEERWGPRLIDLDLVIYADVVMESEILTLPHKFAHERAFVMIPAAEIAPEMIHPLLGKSVRQLAEGLAGEGQVRRIE